MYRMERIMFSKYVTVPNALLLKYSILSIDNKGHNRVIIFFEGLTLVAVKNSSESYYEIRFQFLSIGRKNSSMSKTGEENKDQNFSNKYVKVDKFI